eukprot:scaffold46838_cov77-Phaeocystis_antarctica.AAC.3
MRLGLAFTLAPVEAEPSRSLASQPATDGSAATVRIVCSQQKGVISTGSGKPGPRPSHLVRVGVGVRVR